ncbi:MAG: hypothetical protein V3V99_07180 [candidate division Zixibacteria bacterium]
MNKLSVIDIGTNSVLFSIFDVKSNIKEIHFKRFSPRIGENLKGNKHPRISDENYKNFLKMLKRLKTFSIKQGAERIIIAATNPLRLAQNGQAIRRRLEIDLENEVRVLSPEEEAYLSFIGAVGFHRGNKFAGVIDLGGGSTELISYKGANRKAFISLPEGAVSLTEIFDARSKVNENRFYEFENYLSRYNESIAAVRPFMSARIHLVGGTSSVLAFLLDNQFHNRTEGLNIPLSRLSDLVKNLASRSLASRRKLLAVDKKRAEIIFAGAFWLLYLFKQLNIETAIASPRGLRHGLAREFVRRHSFTA